MPYIANDFLDKEIIGTHTNWDAELARISDDIFVLTQNTDVIKKGDGVNIFVDLEEILDLNNISNIEIISNYIDTTLGLDNFDKIAFFNGNLKIKRTTATESDINYLLEYDLYEENSSVIIPIINGPSQKAYGTSFTLRADSLSSYRDRGCYIETYEWTLHDGTIISGDEAVVAIPNDNGLIGTTWSFDCVAIDILGNRSKKATFTMIIAEADYPVIDEILWELNDLKPDIIDLSWDNNYHEENGSYTLTITATDPQGQDLVYDVVCDDPLVIITQDVIPYIWHVTYITYNEDVIVKYWIAVTNESLLTNTEIVNKTVHNIEIAPIIDSVIWDEDFHMENTSYLMTITAHDPQGQDLTYGVICDDANVGIVQNAIPHIWHITYLEYAEDTDVVFNAIVTNEDLLSDLNIINKTVHDSSPVIDNLAWDNDIHNENESYQLTITAHDPQSQDLTYHVACDDGSVGIVQSGTPNIWDITYGEYGADTDVEYTITVTNEDLLTDIEIDTKTIHNVEIAPIIDSLVWDDGYHEENESYQLTITAHDPQSQDLTYGVVCDDLTVVIVQSGTPNIWDITYGEYDEDTDVEYTITVTNEDLLTDIETDNKTVHDVALLGDRGVFAGGNDGTGNRIIDYITISVLGNAINFGDLTIDNYAMAGCSNGGNDRGIFGGGTFVGDIQYVTISTPGNTTYFGDLIENRHSLSACSNAIDDRGVFFCGYGIGNSDVIDYVTISTIGDATLFGNLYIDKYGLASTSNGVNGRGVAGGGVTSVHVSRIDYITISTPGSGNWFGNLDTPKYLLAATSNAINERGIFGAGRNAGSIYLSLIEYVTITTTGIVTNFGNISVATNALSATSNGIDERGIFAGGISSGILYTDVIEYITISTLGNAINFGDLSYSRREAGECSDA